MMIVKSTIKKLFLIIITALLVIALIIPYNNYWSSSPAASEIEYFIEPNDLVSEMNKMMMSQSIWCEKISYTKANQKQLMQYWKLVSNYKIFHRNGVRKLHSGKSSEVRTLTWHCDSTYECAGLGYRILGIAANLLFAIATNRVLLLKWDKTSAENTYLLPNMIDWRYPNHSLNGSFQDLGTFHAASAMEIFEQEMIDSIAGNTLHVQFLYNRVHSVDNIISKLYSTEMDGLSFSQSRSLQLFLTVSFMYLFRISNELQLFASKIHNKLNLHGKRYVALHIRTGQFDDNLTEAPVHNRFVHSPSSIKLAVECAIRQADKHIGPDGMVVVVSDSMSLKQRLVKEYSRVKALDNLIVHVDKTVKLDNNGMLSTWQDIIIMAEAHLILYHKSSFPLLSMAMCGIPMERTLDSIEC